MDYYFSEHAKQEIKHRCISLEHIESTLNVPQQITEEREDSVINLSLQSMISSFYFALLSIKKARKKLLHFI
jgi:hypothetical protein